MELTLNVLLVAILAGAGIYGLYTVIRLWRSNLLFANRFLYPANCKPEDCTDEAGFIQYIRPRLLLLSVTCIVLAILYVLYWYVLPITLPRWIELIVVPVLGLAVFVWYMFVQNQAYKRFW